MVNKIISRILRRNGSEKKKMSIINKNLLYKPDHGVLSVHAVGRRPVVLVHVGTPNQQMRHFGNYFYLLDASASVK
jgi:hypothetical protein